MMVGMLLMALPLSLVWMVVTADISAGSFLVGIVLGTAILLMIGSRPAVQGRKLSDQVVAFLVYCYTLSLDIIKCSIAVAKCVLKPELCINPGILAVPTQDASENDVIAAFSAHGITITPGELVVDFDGGRTMFVHCLDVEASAAGADAAQTKRLVLLRRVIGVA
jgi:multicomponent Na+:H+ antiporter subunit E